MKTTVQSVADIMKVVVNHTASTGDVNALAEICRAAATDMEIDIFIDGTLQEWEAAMLMRSAVMARLARSVEVRALAASKGYLLPDDPTQRLEEINALRAPYEPVQLGTAEFDALTKAIIDLSRVTKAYDDGRVTFERIQPAWQLKNFEISLDGVSRQGGDPLADLLGYQPDIDMVKRKRALEALSRLDFSKRKPYLLFTADVVKGGARERGTIVCWAKMREASGYNVYKRDVFAMANYNPMTLSNGWLDERKRELRGFDSFMQALSFYDWLTIDDVCAFVDPQTSAHTLFSYEIEGVQRRAPFTPFLFQGENRSLYLTPAQMNEFIRITAAEGAAVSPYPALAQVLYGEQGYGWILAGYNMLASRQRGDSNEDTRSYSFIGSSVEFLVSQISAGRLVVPVDLSVIQGTVTAAIEAYGIGQTIINALDGAGVTLFISRKDELSGFQPTTAAVERAGGGLAKILGAIDPESATLDPQVLLAAMQLAPQAQRYSTSQVGSLEQQPTAHGKGAIDLTTYKGLGELFQLIRTVYDFQPGVLG